MQAQRDVRDLTCCFAFAKNDFGESLPNGAMMVNAGKLMSIEFKLFKRQTAQRFKCGVGRDLSALDIGEQIAQFCGVQNGISSDNFSILTRLFIPILTKDGAARPFS